MLFEPIVPPPKDQYQDSLWVRGECYRFYVDQRREYCTFVQILDLWLQAPCCGDCILSDPFKRHDRPEIVGNGWQMDVLLHVGQADKIIELAESALEQGADYTFECKKCLRPLRPWDGDDIWVLDYHLEEHYGIPLDEPGRKSPPKKLRNRIFQLYEQKCFRCGGSDGLHIDHIRPVSKGGDSAFRNLQPLCERCGNLKGDADPEEVSVSNPIYFTSPPSDAWPHLFW